MTETPKFTFGAPDSLPTVEVENQLASTEELQILTPEQEENIAMLKDAIDISNTTGILTYGVKEQANLSQFSDKALAKVKGKDLGKVGETVTSLVVELKSFDPDEKDNFLEKIFKKGKSQLARMKANYDTVSHNVDGIVSILEGHMATLAKDLATLDELYQMNREYYRNLTVYIEAGEQKITELKNTELIQLKKVADQSQSQHDANAVHQLQERLVQFEKKIHDLRLTRTICEQMDSQIMMVQVSDQNMYYKIQTAIVNTIPIWKNQMLVALTVENAESAMLAGKSVSDVTNDLLRKNSEKIGHVAVNSAKEAERGIVDIETLQYVNNQTISALQEIQTVREEGNKARVGAQETLETMKNELNETLRKLDQSK